MFGFFLELFTRRECLSCGINGHFFCPKCNDKLSLYEPYCYCCKKESRRFLLHPTCQKQLSIRSIIVLMRYRQEGVGRVLKYAKYYNKFKAYEDIIYTNKDFFINFIDKHNSVFVPVPMHFLRRWRRGYNQSEKIAQYLSRVTGIPVEQGIIKKSSYSPQQSKLSREGRVTNLKDSFSYVQNKVDKNTRIYLVDDIVSTGSTLHELGKVLRANGFKNISAVVLASD